MSMTPRERILATLNHEVPDHTPADGWFHDEVVKRLKNHYRTDKWGDVLGELGITGWAGCGLGIDFGAEYRAKTEKRTYKGMTRTGVWRDERTYENGWGVTTRIGESGWYEEWVSGPLAGVEGDDLRAVAEARIPGPADVCLPAGCGGDQTAYAAMIAGLKKQDLFVQGGIPNPYKTAWELRGMDNVLADYLINRDFLEALYERLYSLYTALATGMVRGGIDMLSITGDIAMQDRIIMGPDTWREVDKPRLAKLISDCRAINPDLFVYIHSDGNVMDLMDDIVEIGFDVVNPIQPECMDPVEVKKRWGDRITLHGGVSLQRTLPNGTVAEVKGEVEHLIRHCGYNGGLVMFPSNVIQPDTPVENIIACFHAARDFEVASLKGRPG